MTSSWRFPTGGAVLFAGFFSVVVECTLLFALFLSCIAEGMSRSLLGLVMGVCAVIPYVMQKLFGRVEALLMERLNRVWIGSLGVCCVLAAPLLFVSSPPPALMLVMLCAASMLFFLLFQLFEMKLSLLSLQKRLSVRRANLYLQIAMTVGSAIGGFCAGQVLHSWGLRGIGLLSISLTMVSLLGVTAASRSDRRAERIAEATIEEPTVAADTTGTPGGHELRIAFGFMLVLAAAPATLNFLLPWLVTSENHWSAADFGRLDFLAAFGAFAAILLYGAIRSAWSRSIGLCCFIGASALILRGDSFYHLAAVCLLWGLGMNLMRMQARQVFFTALQSSRDALLWSQRLGLLRVVVEASIPLSLGYFSSVAPSRLFLAVAWIVTGLLLFLVLAELGQRRGGASARIVLGS